MPPKKKQPMKRAAGPGRKRKRSEDPIDNEASDLVLFISTTNYLFLNLRPAGPTTVNLHARGESGKTGWT